MTQYFAKASDANVLSNFTHRFGVNDLTVVSDGAETAIRTVIGSSTRTFFSFDPPGSPLDVEVVMRCRITSTDAFTGVGGAVRVSGTGDADTNAYRSATHVSENYDLSAYQSGTYSSLARPTLSGVSTMAYHWQRLRIQGDQLKQKVWAGTPAEEPVAWTTELTNTQLGVAGWVGIFTFFATTNLITDIGVGTDGDTAPTSQPTNAVTIEAAAQSQPATGSAGLAIQTGPALTYLHDFDGGNISQTSTIDLATSETPTVNVTVRTQIGFNDWKQFYFKLETALNKRPVFNVDASTKGTTTKNYPWYSYDNINWTRFPNLPTGTTTWQFQLDTAFTADNVWIAFVPGYPVSRSRDLIQWLEDNHPQYLHRISSVGDNADWTADTVSSQTDDISRILPAQPLRAYGIWDGTQYPDDNFPKRTVVLAAGLHAGGEMLGSWILEGAVKFLVSGDAKAVALRKNFQFIVYPNINPMGTYGGHRRGQWDPAGVTIDPNRDWVNQQLESTQKLVQMFGKDLAGRTIACMFDYHSHQGADNIGTMPGFLLYPTWADITRRNEFMTAIQGYGNYGYEDFTPTTTSSKWFGDNHSSVYPPTPELKEHADVASTANYFLFGEHTLKALHDLWINHSAQFAFVGKYISLDFGAGQVAQLMDMAAYNNFCRDELPTRTERGLGVSSDGKWRADANNLSALAGEMQFVIISDANYVASQADRAFASNVTIQGA